MRIADVVTGRIVEAHVAASDRPTPRSTVIPRLPPQASPMRPRLPTIIFHGAPPVTPEPESLAEGAARPYESFDDVESADLLTEDDGYDDHDRPTPYRPGLASTQRPPSFPAAPAPWRAVAIAASLVACAAVAFALRPQASASVAAARAASAMAPASTESSPALTAAVATETRVTRVPGTCTVAAKPVVLARRTLVRGGIEATAADDRVAFAALTAPKSGAAFELDATTLAVQRSVKLASDSLLRRVVPELDAEAPVDALADATALRTVPDPEGPATIGVRDGVVVFGPRDGEGTARLWKLEWPATIEAPRVAHLGTAGERVAVFRRAGGIWIGSFRGAELTSELTRLSAPASVGAPSLDAHGDEAIVAWAQRAGTAPWGVRWVRWTASAGAGRVHELALPAGGPGERAMAPSLVALDDGRFLLSWTETGRGRNQVRAQVLDAGDRPLGAAFDVSPPDVVAGQEQIALAGGGKGAVAYLVARRGAFELDATALDCVP
jgi:hypothetical protein